VVIVVTVGERWNNCENAVFYVNIYPARFLIVVGIMSQFAKKKTYYLLRCIVLLIRWVVRIAWRVPKFVLLAARGRIKHKRCG
jgi:hypothetical protein